MGNSHEPSVLSYKTHVLDNGRTFYFPPCQSHINLKDSLSLTADVQGIPHIYKSECPSGENHLGCSVFKRTRDDNKPALSISISSWRSWTTSFLEIVTIARWVLSPSDTLGLFFPITESMLLLDSTLFVGLC